LYVIREAPSVGGSLKKRRSGTGMETKSMGKTNEKNSAKAGSTIPVKFSLCGDKGMDILAQAPTAGPIKCDPTAATDPLEEVSTATVSGLKYDPTANQYIYNWKTSTSYAGTCQQLVVRLADGTTVKSANFKFAK
jgi:hypothetical protein